MEAGREVMDVNGGLTVSLEHLSFEEVIQRAAVSRSAAYRLWPSKIDFYDDLLLDLAGPDWAGAAAFDEDTTTLAHQIVDDHKEMLETEEGRLALVVKAARIGAEQNFQAVTASGQWRTYVVLTSTLVSMPEGETRDKLTQQMKEADDRFLERMATFYKEISARVGIRLRPEFGGDFKVLAALGASAVEGLGIRNLLTPELLGRTYESSYFAPYGEGRWSLASLGFTAILMTLVELDPAFDPRKSG
jgi:AcrR family transcriptional regulator